MPSTSYKDSNLAWILDPEDFLLVMPVLVYSSFFISAKFKYSNLDLLKHLKNKAIIKHLCVPNSVT